MHCENEGCIKRLSSIIKSNTYGYIQSHTSYFLRIPTDSQHNIDSFLFVCLFPKRNLISEILQKRDLSLTNTDAVHSKKQNSVYVRLILIPVRVPFKIEFDASEYKYTRAHSASLQTLGKRVRETEFTNTCARLTSHTDCQTAFVCLCVRRTDIGIV